jgi:hypothetical protein
MSSFMLANATKTLNWWKVLVSYTSTLTTCPSCFCCRPCSTHPTLSLLSQSPHVEWAFVHNTMSTFTQFSHSVPAQLDNSIIFGIYMKLNDSDIMLPLRKCCCSWSPIYSHWEDICTSERNQKSELMESASVIHFNTNDMPKLLLSSLFYTSSSFLVIAITSCWMGVCPQYHDYFYSIFSFNARDKSVIIGIYMNLNDSDIMLSLQKCCCSWKPNL